MKLPQGKPQEGKPSRGKHIRWWICGLLFLATTINYLDRQALSVLNPVLQKHFGWDKAGYGWINFAFQMAYALMYTVAGRLVDLLGTRTGFAIGIAIWSVAAIAHAAARNAVQFGIARFVLGAGESFNFPACFKAVAEWFPQRERALAAGIFNAGSNMGIVISVVVVWMASRWSWQAAFLVTGALGFLWLLLWLRSYYPLASHPHVTNDEREHIVSGRPPGETNDPVRWTVLLRHREAWAFLAGKFLTDPVWWFYLYWLPTYLHDARGVAALQSAAWLMIPYVAADFGSVGGGWLSDRLIKSGWSVGKARYTAMAVCALCMPAAIAAVSTDRLPAALALISLATAAHQGWSANLFTTATDMFPAGVAGSIIGLGGTFGAVGGMLMTLLVGVSLQWTGVYWPVFVWAGLMHPLSLAVFLIVLKGDLPRVNLQRDADLKSSPLLLAAGALTALAGAAGAAAAALHFEALVKVSSASAAAGGVTTGIGITLIGGVLLYAGSSQRTRPVPGGGLG